MTPASILREQLFQTISVVILSRYAKLRVRQAIGPTGVYEIADAIIAAGLANPPATGGGE